MKMKLFILILSVFFLASCGKQENELLVLFDRIDGIAQGSEVKLQGLEVGEVTEMESFEDGVLVKIRIRRNIRIPANSGFSIQSPLIEAPYINIEKGNASLLLTGRDTSVGLYQNKGLIDKLTVDTSRQNAIKKILTDIRDGLNNIIDSSGTESKK